MFKFKQKITDATAADGTKDTEITVPLKLLSNFWRTFVIFLINCEINLILTWFGKYVLSNDTKATTFAITDTKHYVPIVTLSTEDNTKLLEQLKSVFKRTINWNKYQSEPTIKAQNQYLNHLNDPSFQAVSRLFVLLFENKDDRTVHTKYYLPTVGIKDSNIIIDRKSFFEQPLKK